MEVFSLDGGGVMKDREKMDAYAQFAVALQRMKDAEFMRGLEAGKSSLQCVFIWMQGVDGDGNPTTRDDLSSTRGRHERA